MSGGYTWQKAIDLTDADAKNYKDQLPYTLSIAEMRLPLWKRRG